MCISSETLEGLRFTGTITAAPFLSPFTFKNSIPHCSSLFLSHARSKIIVAKSVTELVRYLLKQPGVQYVLTAKLSQDSLESFFGKQRMRGGYSDNPNVSTFLYGAQSLRVQGSVAVKPICGNCKRGHNEEWAVINEEPLPKRRRMRLINP